MQIKFYIIETDKAFNRTKKYIQAEEQELRFAKNSIAWGQKEGFISLVKPIRTTDVFFEVKE